jgi:hypothetical protein
MIDCSRSWLELQPKGKKLWPEEQTEADHLYLNRLCFRAEKAEKNQTLQQYRIMCGRSVTAT